MKNYKKIEENKEKYIKLFEKEDNPLTKVLKKH